MKWLTDDEFFGTEVGTGVEDGTLSMGSAEAKTAVGIAQNSLSSFATSPDFLAKMQVAFGNSFDVEKAVKLASAWAQGDFSEFPEIEIRSEAEINGALGAFAAATGKIYLSREFVAKNAGNVTAVAGVLLEEFGHFVDSQINSVDAIGDEGEIFSDLVQGKALSQGELAGLKGEDDSAIVVLDGEVRAIEQATDSNNTASDDCGDPSTRQAPVYTFYINGVRISEKKYREQDLLQIQNLLNKAGYGSSLDIKNQRNNVSGQDNPFLQKLSSLDSKVPNNISKIAKLLQTAGGGDFIQSAKQGLSPNSDAEGEKYVKYFVDKIKELDEDDKKKAKETCCETPQSKFLIIAHSQGNFFAEDIAKQLPEEIQKRTKILAISPFTDYGTDTKIDPQYDFLKPGIQGSEGKFQISDDSKLSEQTGLIEVNHLARNNDISNRTRFVPGIEAPDANLPDYPQGLSVDAHDMSNYIDPENVAKNPDLAKRTDEQVKLAQDSLDKATQKVQNLLDFDSGVYPEKKNGLIELANTSVTEGDAGIENTAVFTATRSGDTSKLETFTVKYGSNQDTAKVGKDYQAGQGTVTFQPGESSLTITVPIIGNRRIQPDRNFTLTLEKPDTENNTTPSENNTTPAPQNSSTDEDCPAVGTGTIIDDDKGKNGKTYNDPRIVTIDKQYHDFQAAGEFTLIESTTGDLKIQVRQQPVGNNPRSNVSDNTAVATVLAGKRIGIYKDQGLLIDGQPTQIANDDSLAIGDGRIYLEGSTYTIVYPNGDQIVAKVAGTTRVNVEVFLTDERQGKVKGLLGNFNNNPKDDLAKPDGTVIPEPVSQQRLYGEYADSWRVNQAESLFDYNPGENTNTFTLKNYPRQKVKISDLTPADVAKAEQLIGDRIKNPTTREAAIIDLVLTDFDPDILEEAINAPDPDSVLAIASPFTANSDFTTTTVNTATKIDILANDTTAKDPLSIKEFNTKSVAGGIITLDNNNTPDDKTDDKLTYTPPPNFTGTDKFNYLLTDGEQIQAATVNININSLKLDDLSGNNGFVLNGTEAGNFSGVAVSKTGDINGDKIDDIIVGSFGADPNNVNAAGKSQVIFGTQKFPASVNLSQLNGENGFTLNGTDAEGFSGGTVSSAGDINGDGIKDFIIGAFGATVNGQNNAGKTYIVFGTNQGFPANFNLANLNGNNGFAVTGTNTFDYAGLFATGISDINGDRIDDILISAPGPLGGTPGKSYVIYGRTTGFSPNLNLAEINNNNGFVINGIDGNSSGTASSGDINGDGIPDLVIGADGGNTSGGINAGKTYVIFGQQGGFTGSINVPELNGTTGFVIAGLNAEERSGIALTATGDINGDGNKDIVIGAPGATVGDQINAGKTYVIFGKKEGFPVILNPAELKGSNGFIISGFDPEGSAGNAVSYAGDINKDGFDDLLIGASSANSDSKNNAGKTFVIFGKKEFPANFNLGQTNGKNALVLNGVETDGLVGTAVSGGGDINGDGIDDLIVGAPGSLFQDSPGKSYAVFGSRGFGFANPNNGLQGTVQDDIINGTQADETISGRQGNDKIFGNAGQDVLSGNLNDDYLDGEKGQDIVIGGDGNDTLFGGLGNDVLKGDNGNDILTGVDINAINPGIEEIDTLTGGGGSDIFVLGDVNNTYYDNGDSDYALITDFNASEDSIQLQGKADDYLLVPFSQANQTGTAIYRKDSAQNELISILQGGANLSLTGNYFKFVGAG
ncbi:MAG: FG-GAP repeat protein [Microcoleus sp. PH2017_15_JOR_U_A]|uniref:VWD domain-containing protein n=1 Tax=Microcoleus sp. PH2017_15_JOR_U_A TaxID=2798826 RepID=UPI001DC4E342|nr:VWD domain-containing protein [Microcoleus sp. PH2017_15_JOR_U_A]MCC3498852.1 FG-GAP repeat protein [Microcoleus sp. PH2017_15_JOR_U_A]